MADVLGVNKMYRYRFSNASVSIAGDYYQILFDDDRDGDDDPYLLIQRQFEMPDGGVCYFESHDEELIGHRNIESAVISSNRLTIHNAGDISYDMEIVFSATDEEQSELVSCLKAMILDLVVINE